MFLRYALPDGTQKEYKLSQKPVSIGRSSSADIVIADNMASRLHCGISFLDGAFFIRDFKSRNGTFVNDQPIEACQIKSGDRIRIGDTTINVEEEAKGPETVLLELKDAMAKGKGYHTILHEIIDENTQK